MGQKIALKTPKTCLVRVVKKNDVIRMTRKLKSETSSQKIDVSADIIPGSLTLLTGFVILDLKWARKPYIGQGQKLTHVFSLILL